MNKWIVAVMAAALVLSSVHLAGAQGKRIPRIGYVGLSATAAETDEIFKQGLRDLGWVDGQNIAIEYMWAASNTDRLPIFMRELIESKVDLIVAWSTPVIQAAKNATSTVPIVMYSADPLGTGLVA